MNPINTRRWPRYHVHLPVFIAANPGATKVVVPGMVCELSRAGMELYGGVNLQPGELMEVEFQTSGRVHVAGIVRNRSGFCFGLEFCEVRTEPEDGAGCARIAHRRHGMKPISGKCTIRSMSLCKRCWRSEDVARKLMS
jgi:hypothetical protein